MTKFKSITFDVEYKVISGDNYLHLINIETFDDKIKQLIDGNISEICYGHPNRNITVVKKRMQRLLKEDPRHLIGAISEFIVHVYLKEIGFKQEFLFLNLEENSFKKGFDGFYTLANEEWIFESKSGDVKFENATHYDKIGVAYRGLKNTLAGKNKKKNNPWENALNHANNKYINTDENIINELTKLSDNFELEIYSDIKNYNIIPGTTIFLNDKWEKINSAELTPKIIKYFSKRDFKALNVVCVNKKSVNLFLNYIKS